MKSKTREEEWTDYSNYLVTLMRKINEKVNGKANEKCQKQQQQTGKEKKERSSAAEFLSVFLSFSTFAFPSLFETPPTFLLPPQINFILQIPSFSFSPSFCFLIFSFFFSSSSHFRLVRRYKRDTWRKQMRKVEKSLSKIGNSDTSFLFLEVLEFSKADG